MHQLIAVSFSLQTLVWKTPHVASPYIDGYTVYLESDRVLPLCLGMGPGIIV